MLIASVKTVGAPRMIRPSFRKVRMPLLSCLFLTGQAPHDVGKFADFVFRGVIPLPFFDRPPRQGNARLRLRGGKKKATSPKSAGRAETACPPVRRCAAE